MELMQALKRVAVIGAAGKMGRGIALLLLELMEEGQELVLIDVDAKALKETRHYLQQHLIRYAEKHIVSLRQDYAGNRTLVSNQEVIGAYVNETLERTSFQTELAAANGSVMVFEAVVEDAEVKAALLKQIDAQYFFTNTSSIPIHVLQKKLGIGNRLLGLHFYNPPPVQELVELIAPEDVDPEAKQLAIDLAKALGKTVVESADAAGFIGNGHFMREILFACRAVDELSKRIPLDEAIYLINRVTGEYLVRPMGIFQLMDFVGLDVVKRILGIMCTYLGDESLACPLVDKMVEAGFTGGITEMGQMKEGFFQYANNKPIAVFQEGKYRPFGAWTDDIKRALGPFPKEYQSWKQLHKDREAEKKIQLYFQKLFEGKTPAAEVVVDFLLYSKEAAVSLVREGIAPDIFSVNQVLKKGFYHLYDADIPWFNFAAIFRSQL